MRSSLSIKQFRNTLSSVADRVEKGETFIIIRHSKPAFKIIPFDAVDDGSDWETVIDFTNSGKKKGVKIQDALKVLRRLNRS